MREKIIDAALIVTLIIVAFGITWTLLTLNRSDVRPPPAREPVSETPTDAPAITPIPVDPITQETSNDTSSSTQSGNGPAAGGTEAAEETTAPSETQVTVPDPDPVPPGVVQLDRIGFSFVTGGAGACGVVLEPWTHIAVSRELLAAYGCGAEVTVTLDDETAGRTEFRAVIGDTMNPVHSRTVNIYVAEDEPALEYGVTAGELDPG